MGGNRRAHTTRALKISQPLISTDSNLRVSEAVLRTSRFSEKILKSRKEKATQLILSKRPPSPFSPAKSHEPSSQSEDRREHKSEYMRQREQQEQQGTMRPCPLSESFDPGRCPESPDEETHSHHCGSQRQFIGKYKIKLLRLFEQLRNRRESTESPNTPHHDRADASQRGVLKRRPRTGRVSLHGSPPRATGSLAARVRDPSRH